MSLKTKSRTDETETEIDNDQFPHLERSYEAEGSVAISEFFASVPSEYIDSMTILPDSDSLEHLNKFFDETTSTTPAQNADNLVRCKREHCTEELETFDETQSSNFIRSILITGKRIALAEISLSFVVNDM